MASPHFASFVILAINLALMLHLPSFSSEGRRSELAPLAAQDSEIWRTLVEAGKLGLPYYPLL